MGIVGRLDQYASMLAGEFDDYSMSENLMTSSQLGTTILNDGGAVTLSTDTSIINPFSGYDGVLKCVHTTNTPGYFRRGQNMSLTASVTYTFSVFFKNGTVANPYGVANPNVGPGLQVTTFTPTFQELNTSLNTNIPFPNGWYRQVFTFTPSYTQTYQVHFNQAVNQTPLGPLGTYYLYGFQLETGSTATDYTPTTTTAKTRVLPSTTNTNITGFSTYFSSGFSENVGVSTFLPANVFPPYDLVYDEFGGTFFGAGQGRYKRQNTDKSVVVYNEIDEVTDFRDIVRTGLVLDLDAGQFLSYKGTGTTWNDLSGNSNNGTLENSPSYSAANGGTFSFNGSTQRVVCGNATNLQITVGTISSWFNANNGNSGYNGIIAKQNAWGLFVRDNLLVAYDWGNNLERSTGITVGNSTWNYVAMTFTETIGTPSNNAIVYLNGSPVLTTTIRHSNHSIQVMVGEANATQYFGGNIASAQIYNRALTATEITKNYNALKHRFGL